MAMHEKAIIAIPIAARQQREMLWCFTRNVGLTVMNVPSSAIVPRPRIASYALLIDILLRFESIDQCLDALLLRVRRSGGLCLLGIAGRAREVTRRGLDASPG